MLMDVRWTPHKKLDERPSFSVVIQLAWLIFAAIALSAALIAMSLWLGLPPPDMDALVTSGRTLWASEGRIGPEVELRVPCRSYNQCVRFMSLARKNVH